MHYFLDSKILYVSFCFENSNENIRSLYRSEFEAFISLLLLFFCSNLLSSVTHVHQKNKDPRQSIGLTPHDPLWSTQMNHVQQAVTYHGVNCLRCKRLFLVNRKKGEHRGRKCSSFEFVRSFGI